MGVGGTRLVVESIHQEDIHLEVGCILLGVIRLVVEFIHQEDIHLEVGCILLGVTRLGVGYFLLDPGLARDLEVLLRKRECQFIHLVAEVLVGLLGQARIILPVRVSFLLEAVRPGPAVVSILQGLVHQALMDQAQTDQALMARVPTAQAPMAQALRDQVQMAQDPTDQAPMAQVLRDQGQMAQDPKVRARVDPGQMGQVQTVQDHMVQVQMDLGRTGRMDQVPMGLVQAGSLGVEATAKSRRSSPPQNTSAQLRLRLHHVPLHLQPSWQNATLSMEDQTAHYALLARFALSP